jgi:hypothetical protein
MPRGMIVSALNLGMSRTMLTILLTVIPSRKYLTVSALGIGYPCAAA